LRDNELAEAVAQGVVHDTASQDKALWHTEPQVMFKVEAERKTVTQQGVNRDNGSQRGAGYGQKFDDCSVIYSDSKQLESGPSYGNSDDFCSTEPDSYFSRANNDICAYPLNASVVPSFDGRPPHRSDVPPWKNCPQCRLMLGIGLLVTIILCKLGELVLVAVSLCIVSASEMTYIVSSGALNSTHSLVHSVGIPKKAGSSQYIVSQEPNTVQTGGECEAFGHSGESGRPKGRFIESRS